MHATALRPNAHLLVMLAFLLAAALVQAAAGEAQGGGGEAPAGTAAGWNALGSTYASQLRWDAAVDAYSRAIALDPGFARAYFNRGKAYAALGHYDEAIADYERAMALDRALSAVVEPFLEAAARNRGTRGAGQALLRGAMYQGGQFLAVDNTRGRSDVVVALAPERQRGAVLAVYVAKGYAQRFDQVVPPGIYDVYIMTGEGWDPAGRSFATTTGHFRWTLPAVFSGARHRGFTMTFIDWEPPASWWVHAVQPIPPEQFPLV
ncbi:MAG: tetratricopeptide repeat protein [Methanolinea sp.]|nr:tetratricopeptide repeat protein [Methanolinea sp.]